MAAEHPLTPPPILGQERACGVGACQLCEPSKGCSYSVCVQNLLEKAREIALSWKLLGIDRKDSGSDWEQESGVVRLEVKSPMLVAQTA